MRPRRAAIASSRTTRPTRKGSAQASSLLHGRRNRLAGTLYGGAVRAPSAKGEKDRSPETGRNASASRPPRRSADSPRLGRGEYIQPSGLPRYAVMPASPATFTCAAEYWLRGKTRLVRGAPKRVRAID